VVGDELGDEPCASDGADCSRFAGTPGHCQDPRNGAELLIGDRDAALLEGWVDRSAVLLDEDAGDVGNAASGDRVSEVGQGKHVADLGVRWFQAPTDSKAVEIEGNRFIACRMSGWLRSPSAVSRSWAKSGAKMG
jgi:hypothetical protein